MKDSVLPEHTYFIFFALGTALYSLAPLAGRTGSVAVFVLIFCIILTMYRGGFPHTGLSGEPLRHPVRGSHSRRLLTAWSTAGVLGPVLVNYIREYQIDRGVPNALPYNVTMYILAGMWSSGSSATCWSSRSTSVTTCGKTRSTRLQAALAGRPECLHKLYWR